MSVPQRHFWPILQLSSNTEVAVKTGQMSMVKKTSQETQAETPVKKTVVAAVSITLDAAVTRSTAGFAVVAGVERAGNWITHTREHRADQVHYERVAFAGA
jgi:hypothetical protein